MTARRAIAIVGAVLVAALVGIQFVPVERTNPEVVWEIDAPPEVQAVLRRSCYDCHSNETRWPWYSHVAPLSWWMSEHVADGRGDLNFSDWPAFDLEEQALAFDDIVEQLEADKMPLTSYTIMHRDARLSDADRALLLDWARAGAVFGPEGP